MTNSEQIRNNFLRVQEQINQAALNAGRKPEDVTLVTVTKGHSVEDMFSVIQAGAKNLAENYPERALPKIQQIKPNHVVNWHMIGHIQSRKARLVVEEYHLIHSVDSLKLARKLDNLAAERQKHLNILLQLNVSGEQSKFGWQAHEEINWPEVIEYLSEVIQLNHLKIVGLMTIAPYGADPEDARPVFAKLRKFKGLLGVQFPALELDHLSMGMSSDFTAAIKEGATLVRIGTAIMGTR